MAPEVENAWHAHPGALVRFVGDLMAGEIAHLRPGGTALRPPPWALDLPLDEAGLGLDSLERLAVASALSEALHLHESGVEDLLLTRRRFGEWLEIAREGLRHSDARLSFRTSGSAGTPKVCTHALAMLEEEADWLAATLGGTSRRLLVAVPAHHIYGFLFAVLLPTRLAAVEVIDVRRATSQALQQILQAGDLVISHPAHWSLVAKHAVSFPAGVVGVSSTAPCDDLLARYLQERGMQRLLQVYGSSETAGLGWRDEPGVPYTLMPFWSRNPEDDSRLRRATPRGSQVHELQDRLVWLPDGRFHLQGRRDEAVQVGGTNVFPARIRRVLLEHPGVADAAVRLMSPSEGARLKAFVVPVPGANEDALRSELELAAQSRLSAPERPKSWTFGTRLPFSAQGKPCDWPLAATLVASTPV